LPPAKSYYFVSVLFKNIPGEQETAVDGSYINDLDVCEKKTQFVGKWGHESPTPPKANLKVRSSIIGHQF